jgi:hypothetical protein
MEVLYVKAGVVRHGRVTGTDKVVADVGATTATEVAAAVLGP